VSTFVILFSGAILGFAFRQINYAKLWSILVLIVAGLLVGQSLMMDGFASSEVVRFFEPLLFIVMGAAIISETERINMVQILFLGAASVLLLHSTTLMHFVFAFEAVSIVSMVLVAHIQNASQSEGAVKMFIAGALATGFIMIGLTIMTLSGHPINTPFTGDVGALESIGLWIILLGIFYKLTIVPMHAWAADSYALVRPSHAAVLSGIAKTVVVIAVFKLFSPWLDHVSQTSIAMLLALAVITMTLGNFLALFQQRLGKIFAYSSIAHAGYMLMAIAVVKSNFAATGILYLAVAYIFMQTAVFLVLDHLGSGRADVTLDEIKSLASTDRLSAFFMSIQLFSLAGIPLLAGFLGKAVAIYAVVDAGYWPIALIALLNSALSVGYYAWIVKHIYFDASEGQGLAKLGRLPALSQGILFAGTLYFGVVAVNVFSAASHF
jgi:NADH:ubiquinone oxidoreductase subunit 2 (subunit N)